MSYLSETTSLPSDWQQYKTDQLAIRGARLFDPAADRDETNDIIIENGKINHIGSIPDDFKGQIVEAKGLVITPGLFDMHVHLREPGFEHKETVRTGCMAAAAGGFTGVAPMPNTNPVTDNPGIVDVVKSKACDLPVDVFPIAAITHGSEGMQLTEMGELNKHGVTAFSDDGSPVSSAAIMRLALEYTKMFNAVIIEHCENRELAANGIMDENDISTSLGLPGIPAVAEELDVYRCIRLAEYTGARVHIAHISTSESVRLLRAAKARGINITAEVMPHHLTLDCSVLRTFNSDYKVNPPLRQPEDINMLIAALADGTIDAIATDHAPHAPDEKEVELVHAPFGMIGLETALAVILTKLVRTGKVTLKRVIEALTSEPRRIMNLPEVTIKTGEPANLTIYDPEERWIVDRDKMLSKAKNTPFHGWELTGKSCGIINRGLAWIRER